MAGDDEPQLAVDRLDEILLVDSPGTFAVDLSRFDWSSLSRPKYPLDGMAEFLVPVDDLVDGLLPGDGLPLVAAALADPL